MQVIKNSSFYKNLTFIILALVLFVFEILLISKGQWGGGDFWEHSAVINELIKSLLQPSNPIIKSEVPHAFFSPYSVLVAAFARFTNINAIEALQYFAYFNLLFFLSAFYFFCKNLFKENYFLIAPLSLFFILFLWGNNPPVWSGFFHIFTLHYVLPYPSTFAMALCFLIFTLVIKNNNRKQVNIINIAIVLLTATVLIAHPTTAIFLIIFIAVLNFFLNGSSYKKAIIKSAIEILPGILLCMFWPYYDFIDLLMSNNPDFHKDSRELYLNVIRINWPLILVLPVIILLPNDKIVRIFTATIIIMLAIYASGYLLKIYGLGRLISNILMCAHFLIAYTLVKVNKKHHLAGKLYTIALIFALLLSLYLNRIVFKRTLAVLYMENTDYYSKFSFLKSVISPGEVILSDENSNLYIPTFDGKVISVNRPLHWVNDIEERRNDVKVFFGTGTPDSLRNEIIKKYRPDYLLLDFSHFNPDNKTIKWMKEKGKTVYNNNSIELIHLKED